MDTDFKVISKTLTYFSMVLILGWITVVDFGLHKRLH